jgi:two-component system, sensor histidine kinase and response regulator
MFASPPSEGPYHVAMQRLGADAETLRRVVAQFVRSYADGASEAAALVHRRSWPELGRFAHGLKSVAGLLGDETLTIAAKSVETACRDDQTDAIGRLVSDLSLHLEAAIATATAWLATMSTVERAAPAPIVDAALPSLRVIAQDLHQLLQRRSMNARKVFAEFKRAAAFSPYRDRLAAMELALERLDFAEAQRLMADLPTGVILGAHDTGSSS